MFCMSPWLFGTATFVVVLHYAKRHKGCLIVIRRFIERKDCVDVSMSGKSKSCHATIGIVRRRCE